MKEIVSPILILLGNANVGSTAASLRPPYGNQVIVELWLWLLWVLRQETVVFYILLEFIIYFYGTADNFYIDSPPNIKLFILRGRPNITNGTPVKILKVYIMYRSVSERDEVRRRRSYSVVSHRSLDNRSHTPPPPRSITSRMTKLHLKYKYMRYKHITKHKMRRLLLILVL